LDEKLDKIRSLCYDNLFFFAKAVLGFDWLDPEIHYPLCQVLQRYDENRRVGIVLPRGWLKTTLCSQAYPIWRAIRNPSIRILLVQNTFTNACSKLKTIKAAFDDNMLFRALFPELLPDSDCTWSTESACIKRPKTFNESTFEAAGIRTQVTSRHYDLIIEDDTVAPDLNELQEENVCPTKDDIDQAIGWHRLALPLLVNPGESQIMVVGTRWFEKDLISWVEERDKSFKMYKRACRETDGQPDENGAPAYPSRFPLHVLEEIKNTLGPYLYSCLYMNSPVRSADMIFQPEWIKYYDEHPPLNRLICYTTVDPSGDPGENKSKDSDFNVVLTAGKDTVTGAVYVLGYFRKKCSPGEVIDALFTQVALYHPVMVASESVAYQGTFKYWVKERMKKDNIYFPIDGYTHGNKAKSARILGLQPLFASGSILIRPWMKDLVRELLAFPNGVNDDIIDGLASQLQYWRNTRSVKEAKKEDKTDPMSAASAMDKFLKKDKYSTFLYNHVA
jgi:predicted phage terminase large subunit-like protein